MPVTQAASTIGQRNSLRKRFKNCPKNLKTQQTQVIFYLYSRKTRAGKSNNCSYVVVSEKLRFQNAFGPHSVDQNAEPAFSHFSGLKSSREGLVWTVQRS